MTHKDFVDLVKRMRAKQKEYFATKNQNLLNECRDLERRVDGAVKAFKDSDRQTLFGDEPGGES